MSLVNDMLRDLAKRQHTHESSGPYDSEMLLRESSLLQKKRHNWLPSVMVFVVVVLLALSVQKIVPLMQTQANNGTTAIKEPTTAPLQTEQPPAVVANAFVAESVPLLIETFDEAPVTNSYTGIEMERIYRLLQQAERALTLDRLTAPIEDNAHHYYREILSIAPDNSPAQEGLQRIAQRYLQLAQDAYAKGDTVRVNNLLQRAEFVAPGYGDIAVMRQQLESVNEQTAVQVADVPLESSPEPASVSVATIDVAEAGQGNMGITPNPAWQDQQAAAQADLLIGQGQYHAAELSLQQFIGQHQKPVSATKKLFDLYLQQTNYDAGRLLLQQAQAYLPAQDSAHLTARLLVAQGHHDAALSVLEKELDRAGQDESYRALLAALYHKTGRYQESVSNYRRLLDGFGEKPAYWLGLALALDALQQSTSALEAYRRIGLQGAQPQVKDYVEQRIAALSH